MLYRVRRENELVQRYFAELKKSGYDRNVMPEGNGGFGSPVEVLCEMCLLDISEVDDLHMVRKLSFCTLLLNTSSTHTALPVTS
ncbi:hypothetical protein AVEN_149337-1 [Araneus ventricosus]|uniref:Uncharacterized protein n=1 Tax=Araneus ventricosus TaxID=182803 RepID=A0A4Y2UYJ2_ARAVE|nr:hypothetical protein AVEN_171551-1 [Araneus ventricosus]GBO16670.1 hypothetical protein AVEN_149337-1 [Araneus ventricosus]